MPPTSSVDTILLTKVLTRPQTSNNTIDSKTTENMCLSSPSDTTSATCRRASCNSVDQSPTTNTCTTSSSCDVRHRKHASLSAIATNTIKTTKALEDNNNNKSHIDLSEDEKHAVYKECATKAASVSCNALTKADDSSVEFKPQIRWPDLIAQVFIHLGALYGLYLLFFAKLYTFIWVVLTIWSSGVGITAGAHRLWSHKSYTAAMPLRLLLVFLFTIAGQRDAYTWALDHRIHHKFSETEADPHNAKRGFFFSHVGWLFLTPHPKVEEKRKVIDMSDLENDRVVMFQRKWYIPLFATFAIALPVLVPCYYWNEDLWMSFWINFNMRFCATLNVAFFVNSVAHMWGRKPYDKNISPVESPIVSFLALGEGWHNYHHVFPWDYKTSELGTYSLNVTTAFLDFCARLGWVTGRKSVSLDMVARRAAKCGDGTHFLSDEHAHKDQVWGYGDRDLPREDVAELETMKE